MDEQTATRGEESSGAAVVDGLPADACGPDCHETDCIDRAGCEYCNARPHRDTMSVHDSLAGDINLCAECSPHECDCECDYCEERFHVGTDDNDNTDDHVEAA